MKKFGRKLTPKQEAEYKTYENKVLEAKEEGERVSAIYYHIGDKYGREVAVSWDRRGYHKVYTPEECNKMKEEEKEYYNTVVVPAKEAYTKACEDFEEYLERLCKELTGKTRNEVKREEARQKLLREIKKAEKEIEKLKAKYKKEYGEMI